MTADKKILLLSNIVAHKLVWESVPHFNKAASLDESYTLSGFSLNRKIWGVGVSNYRNSKILEFYVSSNYDTNKIRNVFKRYSVGLRFIRTPGFESYVVLGIKPTVITGNPAYHYRLNGWGTLGGYVDDAQSNYRLAISNNHIFGLSNAAKINDRIIYNTGASVIDLGGFYRKVDFQLPPSINIIDAAVCWIRDDVNLKWARKKPVNSTYATIGMEVYKIGAATGYTEGYITSVNFKLRVRYPGLGILNFNNSLIIQGKEGYPFSLPGDSGSLVFKKKAHEVVGMIFAGDGTYSFANVFKNVESQLQISI